MQLAGSTSGAAFRAPLGQMGHLEMRCPRSAGVATWQEGSSSWRNTCAFSHQTTEIFVPPRNWISLEVSHWGRKGVYAQSQPEGEPVSEKEIPFHPDSSSHRPVRETEAEALMVGGNTPRPGLLGDTHLTLVPFK